jgi:hypothetical protein
MANFKTHLTIAAIASTGAAIIAVDAQLIKLTETPWFIFLGIIGGMLPDIDASNSKPVRLLFTTLALMSAVTLVRSVQHDYVSYQVLIMAAATYALVRYGVFALFNRLTTHRGVFHSLLAALFFGLMMTCASHYFLRGNITHAWLNGVFITLGFIVHLLLDEAYSVDLVNKRMKKSFGTALKLFSYNNIGASVLMTLGTLALYNLAPTPEPLIRLFKVSHWQDVLAPLIKSL